MERNMLTRLEYWTAGMAFALAIDLLALPWVDVSIGPYSYSSSGIGSPDGFLGVLALLFALAISVDVLLAGFAPGVRLTRLETFGRGRAPLLGAIASGSLVVLKLLLHLHPSYLGAGCWIALALAAGLVVSSARLLGQPEAAAPHQTRTDPETTPAPPSAPGTSP
jgi:hypothetical protein